MNAIELSNLTKRFGALTAVDGLDLSIPKGELFGLVGSDGAGKTTTLRMLTGVLDAGSGDATVLGFPCHDLEPVRSRIGYMSQRFGLYPDLTVMENIRFHADIFGVPKAEWTARAERLLAMNVLLMLFNLLPAFPMDGGRVLRAFLAMWIPYARATRIAATVGQAMAFLFGFYGLVKFQPILILIALFVWIGASQEATAVEFRAASSSARVRDAMLTHFRTLAPGQTLGDAARHLLAGSQQDFPVMETGRLTGILFRKDLFRALQERGESMPVALVMRRDVDVVTPEELLDSALGRVHADQGTTLAVMENGQLTGLLTAENVGEFFMIQAALERSRGNQTGGAPRPDVPPVISVYTAQARRAH